MAQSFYSSAIVMKKNWVNNLIHCRMADSCFMILTLEETDLYNIFLFIIQTKEVSMCLKLPCIKGTLKKNWKKLDQDYYDYYKIGIDFSCLFTTPSKRLECDRRGAFSFFFFYRCNCLVRFYLQFRALLVDQFW